MQLSSMKENFQEKGRFYFCEWFYVKLTIIKRKQRESISLKEILLFLKDYLKKILKLKINDLKMCEKFRRRNKESITVMEMD